MRGRVAKFVPVFLGIKKRNLTNRIVAFAVIAIALSAHAFLPNSMLPAITSQALAANPNSNGNGNSGNNNGNGGKSSQAGSKSSNGSSGGGPASGKGKGGGLLRLLMNGSARLPFAGSRAPAETVTGPPLQLVPPRLTRPSPSVAPAVSPPDPRPVAPVYVLPSKVADTPADAAPATQPGPHSLEYYLQASTASEPDGAEDTGIAPTYETNLVAAVNAIEANSSFDATVDAYKALAAIIAAFQEAENLPENE